MTANKIVTGAAAAALRAAEAATNQKALEQAANREAAVVTATPEWKAWRATAGME